MQNLDKIKPIIFEVSANRWKFFGDTKEFVFQAFPKIFGLFAVGAVLLILQILFIGTADRFGFSPKWSVLFSSLFLAFAFGGLAILGGIVKEKNAVENSPFLKIKDSDEPVCKILTIHRKDQKRG